MTSYGVECRLPIFEAHGITVAVLLCRLAHGDDHLGLILTADPSARDPTRRRYHVGARYRDDTWTNIGVLRLASLGADFYNLRFDGAPVQPQWRTVHIVPAPPDWAAPEASVSRFTLNCGADPPFRLPHTIISKFVALGFTPTQTKGKTASGAITVTRIAFSNLYRGETIYLDLGLCRSPGSGLQTSEQGGDGARWARAMIVSPAGSYGFEHPDPGMHDCARHHVDSWPDLEGRTMAFGGADRTVRLSFAPCKVMPETTVVVRVELAGFAYEDMLRGANVVFPPLTTPTILPGYLTDTPSTIGEGLELFVQSLSVSLPPSPGPSTPRPESSTVPSNPFPDTARTPSPPPQEHRGPEPAAVAAQLLSSGSRRGSPRPSAPDDAGPLGSDTSWILGRDPSRGICGQRSVVLRNVRYWRVPFPIIFCRAFLVLPLHFPASSFEWRCVAARSVPVRQRIEFGGSISSDNKHTSTVHGRHNRVPSQQMEHETNSGIRST